MSKTTKLPSEVIDEVLTQGRAGFNIGLTLRDNPHGDSGIKSAVWRLGWLKERDGK